MAKRNPTEYPDPALLREYFSYSPETGELRWKKAKRSINVGDIAGCLSSIPGGGHRRIVGFNYQLFHDYRIVWAIVTGKWPTQQIDHINGDPLDNRWCNLREATQSENNWNIRRASNNTSGYKGVSWHSGTKKWTAAIMRNRKSHWLGSFETKGEARQAYIQASKKLHGEFSIFHQIRPSGAKR